MVNYYEAATEDAEQGFLVSLRLLTRNTRLFNARKAHGVTQGAVGVAINMARDKFADIENLKVLPSFVEREDIADYLDLSSDYLFRDSLLRGIESGVFDKREVQLEEAQIISLTEAARLQPTYDGESEMIKECDRHLLKEQISQVLDKLGQREKRVIELRYGILDGKCRLLEDIGKEFNVTRERIRQIEAKALRKLRHPARSRMLKGYLE